MIQARLLTKYLFPKEETIKNLPNVRYDEKRYAKLTESVTFRTNLSEIYKAEKTFPKGTVVRLEYYQPQSDLYVFSFVYKAKNNDKYISKVARFSMRDNRFKWLEANYTTNKFDFIDKVDKPEMRKEIYPEEPEWVQHLTCEQYDLWLAGKYRPKPETIKTESVTGRILVEDEIQKAFNVFMESKLFREQSKPKKVVRKAKPKKKTREVVRKIK